MLRILTASNQNERNLLSRRSTNLLREPIRTVIHLNTYTVRTQLIRNLGHVVVERLSNRHTNHLDRCQPCRERARIVLSQHAQEALNRAELRRVNHDRLLHGTVSSLVLQTETARLVKVVLHGRHLPGTANRVLRLNRNLRAVERSSTGIRDELQAGLLRNLLQNRGSFFPLLIGTDELVLLIALGVAGGQLKVEVSHAEVLKQAQHELQQVTHLVRCLLLRHIRVGVVLANHAHAGQALQHAGLLVTVHGAELEETQRQLTVRAATRTVNLVVHRAVHGLQTVMTVIQLHGREHAVRIVRKVTGSVEQVFLRNVRGADVLETLLNVAGTHVVFHLALNHAALRVNHRQAGTNVLREGEQIQLTAQATVVAALRLSDALLVRHQLVLSRPCGTVNTLQHGVLLRTAPVRATGTHQGVTVSDQLGVRQVRAAAEVLPDGLAGLRVHVVVNGDFTLADLHGCALGSIRTRTGALAQGEQLQLVRFIRHLGDSLVVGDHAAAEQLTGLDDLNHRLLDLLQIFRGERLSHIKVKVEAVSNVRANAQLGVLAVLLHRLRHHVRSGVAQNVQAVRLVNENRLNGVASRQLVGEINEHAVHACHNDRRVVSEQLSGSLRGEEHEVTGNANNNC